MEVSTLTQKMSTHCIGEVINYDSDESGDETYFLPTEDCSDDETYFPQTEDCSGDETDEMDETHDEDGGITLDEMVPDDTFYDSVARRVQNRRNEDFKRVCSVYVSEMENITQDYFRDPYTHDECITACTELGRLIPVRHKVKLQEEIKSFISNLVPSDRENHDHVTQYTNVFNMS